MLDKIGVVTFSSKLPSSSQKKSNGVSLVSFDSVFPICWHLFQQCDINPSFSSKDLWLLARTKDAEILTWHFVNMKNYAINSHAMWKYLSTSSRHVRLLASLSSGTQTSSINWWVVMNENLLTLVHNLVGWRSSKSYQVFIYFITMQLDRLLPLVPNETTQKDKLTSTQY